MRLLHLLLGLLALVGSLSTQAANLADITQLYKNGKADEALTALDAYLASLPRDSWGRNVTQARFLKGVILSEQKRTAEAIRVFSNLTLDYPDLPEPYNNLAALYVAQGKYEAARDTLERAMRTDPTYAALHANLSDVYAKLSSKAYDKTLRAATSKAAPERIRELCDSYGSMASLTLGRTITPRRDADFLLLREVPSGRTAAAQPPAHIDIDEMAMEAPTEPTKPAPAAANLEPKPAAFAPSPLEEQVILKSVQDWAAAWSSKDVNAYLGYYAEDFRLPSGGSRSAWAAQRRERISTPKSIRLGIESPQVTFTDGTHARVTFQQAYRSETVQKLARKTLLMVKTGGKWLIQEERVGG